MVTNIIIRDKVALHLGPGTQDVFPLLSWTIRDSWHLRIYNKKVTNHLLVKRMLEIQITKIIYGQIVCVCGGGGGGGNVSGY